MVKIRLERMRNGFVEKKETFTAKKNRIFQSLKNLTSHAKRDLRARKFLARLHSPYCAW